MFTRTTNAGRSQAGAADVLIPVIRTAATIGYAIAPCSLGFVIIAVSEQLIRSIMVGEDPEMLVSDLQNQFPNDAIQVIEDDDARLVSKVVDLVADGTLELPLEACSTNFDMGVIDKWQSKPAKAGQACGL
jgi:AraC family transcriptional regulator of adaptative response/methylated-DNA-[protein]-cysteine methyltransferase